MGAETGAGRLWPLGALAVAFMALAPQVLQLFTIINLTTAIALALLGLSLGLIWGYGGILCFGQTVFFGLGAYAYAVAAQNFGDTSTAVLVAIAVGAAFAALLGYFMFFGRVSDVYLGAITLTVTLVFFSLIRRTSGPEYKIGDALLGGFNGTSAPPLTLPWDSAAILFPNQLFYVAMSALTLSYFGCVWLTRSRFGRVCAAVRENETRAELLGYDARLYKLGLFTIGGGLAGLAGVLMANGVGRVTPDLFGLPYAAQAIIWVIVGGRGTLIGPILGAFGIFYLNSWLGSQQLVNLNVVLGLVLIVFVLLLPQGLAPTAMDLAARAMRGRGRARRRRRPRRALAAEPAE
ncbi:branched-chain amino acid ABC transporter permease [Rubrimonas cliftonensis]|uniref:Amino acid/amide ABC transporter membrane protein 2, HAAT family n=1 Tax=Rubrimonas cliftonensis TaxID=89524 RepID=A0A1H4D798_9RHOB|nr:branched-chain amino acid ABC transporter permease [Rubrimonas cliftonensis]SEA68561.1 amino acid/amide ABC transporter membrane protein 2, HAAT family [Rubrimonas cliftonensis]